MPRMLDSGQPCSPDVITPCTEHVLPFIPAGRTMAEMIYNEGSDKSVGRERLSP